jgi:hypothetical protein
VLVGLVGGDAPDPATVKGLLRKAAKILQQDPVRGALRKAQGQQHRKEEDAPLPWRARAAEAVAPAVTAAAALEGPSTKTACLKEGLPLAAVAPPQVLPSPAQLADKRTAGGSENGLDTGAPVGWPLDLARPSRPPLTERRLPWSESRNHNRSRSHSHSRSRRRRGPGPEGSRRGGAGKENARAAIDRGAAALGATTASAKLAARTDD